VEKRWYLSRDKRTLGQKNFDAAFVVWGERWGDWKELVYFELVGMEGPKRPTKSLKKEFKNQNQKKNLPLAIDWKRQNMEGFSWNGAEMARWVKDFIREDLKGVNKGTTKTVASSWTGGCGGSREMSLRFRDS